MTNQAVIKSFMEGATRGHTPVRNITYGGRTSTLSIDGDKLYNYWTIIAIRDGDTIRLNTKKYSATTSKIQSQIKRIARENNYRIISMNGGKI